MTEEFTVELEGGSPWGFALQGGTDHRSPLRIGKVTPGGRAAKGGLLAGDYILSINGELCKELKHLQAQQLVKKSKSNLTLHCTKVRPGVTSPAPRILSPSLAFSFPVTNGNKTPPIKARPPSVTYPKPPPVPTANGHARSGSLGMPSDPNSATSASSPSSCSALDAEDSKFLGVECSTVGLNQTHALPNKDDRKESPCSIPDSEVADQDNLVPAPQQNEVISEHQEIGNGAEKMEENGVAENGAEKMEENGVAEGSQDEGAVEDETGLKDVIEKNGNEILVENGTEMKEQLDPSSPEELEDKVTEEAEDPVTNNVMEEAELSVATETEPVDGNNQCESASPTVATATSPPVAMVSSPPVATGSDSTESGNSAPNGANLVGGVTAAEVEESLKKKEQSGHTSSRASHGSRGGSFSKWDLADSINQAAQARSSRESSMDLSNSCKSEDLSTERPPNQQQQKPPQQQPKPQQKQPQFSSSGVPTGRPLPGPSSQAVIKPTLKVKRSSLDTREPGWYQQMFQTFSNQVDSDGEDDKEDSKDTYVYDHRGLKVRKNSVGKGLSDQQTKEAEEVKQREESPSPDSPLYVYDYRGLRVPAKNRKEAGNGAGHVRMGSTPAVMQGAADKSAPTSGRGTRFVSVSSAGTTKEDVLHSSKKQTAFKTQHYSTSNTRNYWKQKDKDQAYFDQERRKSQEAITHRRSSSSDIAAAKMSAHIHPLLRADDQDTSTSGTSKEGTENSGSVLNRIDAAKLHGAVANASVLGTLEQEGVPTQMLPSIAQQNQLDAARQKELEEKKKKLKPPPGPRAIASFTFEGQSEKELSFEKGDFVDLTHLVDDNWLEGTFKGKTGIFPKAYVKVLSESEYSAMTMTRPDTPKQTAKALYEFKGQTDKELDLEQGAVVTIDRKVDDNWYSGTLGNKKGIFPVAYVQLIESEEEDVDNIESSDLDE